MKIVQQEFGKRLREAMIAAGYEAKPAVLEREFNLKYMGKPMTLHGVRRWLLGETIPAQDKLVVLARWLKIEPQILRWGVTANAVREDKLAWEHAISYQERETFEAFLSLTAAQKKTVREVIHALAGSNAKENQT
ncbi:MAG TPA: hypothetical protein VLC91_13910 [Spongiibacteraceae bacterium]|nr:hypothetical protein [Spongiibacteraceae bacterium]